MPTLTVYRHGATMGQGNPNAKPPPRTAVTGWSAHAVRRNLLFLYSVDERGLEGLSGLALTLTVRDCPQDPQDWQRARDSFLKGLRRSGVVFVHWVTEWQRRGAPHLHLAAYWPPNLAPNASDLLAQWLRIAGRFGALHRGQHAHPIWDVLGWNQYVSKHAARGLHHYQRNPENIPEAWRGRSTGRMWGKLGTWPIVDPAKLDMDPSHWHRLRRIVRSWRLADARKATGKAAARRIRSARSMLRCPDPRLSAVRGLSEWMSQPLTLSAVAWLAAQGARIEAV